MHWRQGSSGIGYAIANSFLKNGAKVIIAGRNIEKLNYAKEKLIQEMKCEKKAVEVLELDISSVHEIEKVFSVFLKNRKIDIFVNNAGTNGGDLFPNTLETDYDKVLNTNLKGMYFVSQEIAKYMVENKIKGNILNITSSSAMRSGISPYIISKWGERSLTLGMAKKYLPYGIVVNGLAPEPTLTPMLKQMGDENLHLEYSPSKRYATSEEMGEFSNNFG